MQTRTILSMAAIASLALTGCSKLGDLAPENFAVTPTPLEAVSGEVPFTVNATFPVKYMKKKAVVTVTPVLKYDGKEATSQSATFQGEKVEGNATTVQYKVGGNYAMKGSFQYQPEMLESELYARFDAKLGKKKVSLPEVKIGHGVLATSDLMKRCLTGSTGSTATDAYVKTVKKQQEATIKFLINQANLRTSELESVSVTDLVNVLKEINDNTESRMLSAIEVSAYASPDGKFEYNEKLAEKRQDAATGYLRKQLEQMNLEASIDKKFTAEDWNGFQQLISNSNLQDKDVILRVLSMYDDPEEREAKIKEMGSIYPEIAHGIMPELRRARMIVSYELIGRSDEQIKAQYRSDASQLSVEELLYGANNLVSGSERQAWLKKITELYPRDYRAYNNLAQYAYAQGDMKTAEDYLKKAKSISNGAKEVNANMAMIELQKGNTSAAETLLAQGSGAEGFNSAMAALNVAKGNYAQAAKAASDVYDNTSALAQIMNKDYTAAKNTLAKIKNADANTSYLRAVLAARTGDSSSVVSNLREAISKDSSLARRAAADLEFAKYASAISGLLK